MGANARVLHKHSYAHTHAHTHAHTYMRMRGFAKLINLLHRYTIVFNELHFDSAATVKYLAALLASELTLSAVK